MKAAGTEKLRTIQYGMMIKLPVGKCGISIEIYRKHILKWSVKTVQQVINIWIVEYYVKYNIMNY